MAVDASIFNGLIQPVRSVADYENAFAERANQKVKNALAMRQMALQEKEMSQHEAVQNALSQHGLTAAGADAVARAGGVQGMELGMKIRAQLEAQRKEQERQAALRSLMPVTGIDANKVSGVTGPRPEALGVVGQQQPFNPAQFLAAGMDPKQVEGIQSLVAPKPKVKDYKPVRMPDGSVQLVGLTEDGRTIQTGQTPFERPSTQNFGDYIGGVDPISGKVTRYGNVGMSPDKVDASQRGWASILETGRHNAAKEGAATPPQPQSEDRSALSARLGVPVAERDPFAGMSQKAAETFRQSLYKAADKRLGAVAESAAAAQSMARDVKQFLELQNKVSMQGPLAGRVPAFSDEAQTMDAITARITPQMRQPGSGATSDFDARMFQSATVGRTKGEEANKMVGNAVILHAENSANHEQFLRDYLSVNGHLDGADRQWKKYIDANPIFDPKSPGAPKLNEKRVPYQQFFGSSGAPGSPAPVRMPTVAGTPGKTPDGRDVVWNGRKWEYVK